MRAYTVPVLTPAALEARIDLAVVADNQPFDLTGASVFLEIWDTRSDDQLVYSASDAEPVITVSDIIVVDIPADTAVYSDLVTGYKYRYGLTITHPELSFVVQGDWQKLKTYGPVSDSANSWTVSTTDATVTINGGTGPKGDQGVIGPAGPWQAVSRVVTSSTAILPTDTLVFAKAGGGSIEIALPAPADIWDGTNGRVITISRTLDDTGTVTIIGDADGMPLELLSGPDGSESVYVTTTDGINLVVDDAPFVVQTVVQGLDVAIIKDLKPTGTPGGTSISGLNIRDLSYINSLISGLSLSGKDITIPAGTYLIEVLCESYEPEEHKIAFYNKTDDNFELIGKSSYSKGNGAEISARSSLTGIISLSVSKVFQVIHYLGAPYTTIGLGVPSSIPGVDEEYTSVKITKISE